MELRDIILQPGENIAWETLHTADLDKDVYWYYYYNILLRKDTALVNKFLLDVTLLKWRDDVDGLVLRATGFQESEPLHPCLQAYVNCRRSGKLRLIRKIPDVKIEISADFNLHCLGDIDFKIKVERSRGLDMASKFRIPIYTYAYILDSRPWEPTLSANTLEPPDETSGLLTVTVDSSRVENNKDLYFYIKIIRVSRPLRVTVVEGQAVIVRNARELCWVWAPTGHCPTSTEVPKGLHIEVINATIRKEDI
ncbi:hypothetical protein QBC40DRAFT_300247 [Triangularia verruculosa]|uniref:Uncharacterized protein n=1 Tax=Triangularia verruculosa TaxID=2587418 RepID=A0AAN7AS30_9PEZI|nr:hypothetical protein QBC40DRAFT_300247 [Triangularia verruculosa]